MNVKLAEKFLFSDKGSIDFDELEQFLRNVELGDRTRITIPQPKMNMIIITKPDE